MKLILPLAVLLTFSSWSQKDMNTYNTMNFYIYKIQSATMEDETYYFRQDLSLGERADRGISKVELVQTNKKKQSKETIELNQHGRIVHRVSSHVEIINTFQGDTLLLSTEHRLKRKTKRVEYAYENGQVVSVIGLENGKKDFEYQYEYHGDKLISTKFFDGKHHFEIRKEYKDDQLAKTTFTKDEELVKTWVYDCKPQGTEVKKSEDFTQVCYYTEESRDGSYKKYRRELIDGVDYLLETSYSADSTYIGNKKWKNDSILVYEHQINDDFELIANYKKNGKFYWGYKTTFNAEKKPLERITYSGKKKKLGTQTKYQYDDGLATSVSYAKKEKVFSSWEIEYEYF